MSETIVGGVSLRRFGTHTDPPNATQLSVLKSTVSLLPVEHLVLLRSIEARRPGQVPRRGGGNNPQQKVVRLSAVSFSGSYNFRVNLTFLHEMGHIVDAHFGCTTQVQKWVHDRTHPLHEDATALMRTPHTGATDWAGERIADCYMVLMRSLVMNDPYSSGSCPSQYRGAEAQRRFRVLLHTTAFRNMNLNVERLREDNNPDSFDTLIRSLI